MLIEFVGDRCWFLLWSFGICIFAVVLKCTGLYWQMCHIFFIPFIWIWVEKIQYLFMKGGFITGLPGSFIWVVQIHQKSSWSPSVFINKRPTLFSYQSVSLHTNSALITCHWCHCLMSRSRDRPVLVRGAWCETHRALREETQQRGGSEWRANAACHKDVGAAP